MATPIEEFAHNLLQTYDGAMDATAHQLARDDNAAGEYEIAAISIVEMAPVTEAEINQLLTLAETFNSVDADVARRVAAKIRATNNDDPSR